VQTPAVHAILREAFLVIARTRSPEEERRFHALLEVLETAETLRHRLRCSATTSALTETGFKLLAHLCLHPSGEAEIETLASALGQTPSDTATAVARLELSALVTWRHTHGPQRRSTVLATSAGREAFDAALHHHFQNLLETVAPLAADEIEALDRACSRLRLLSNQPNA
jgi:DNA-binding MarR family transcriptional regulator